MKKIILVISVIIAGIVIYSCTKEKELTNNTYKPSKKTFDFSQFGKIETVYNERENPIKETDTLPKDGPEIGIEPDILDTIITSIEDSVPEILKSLGDCGYVGVFKKSTCRNSKTGQNYTEVVIYFDSEDDNNQNRMDGETGGSYRTGNNDIEMHFCLVPQDLFGNTGVDYGVLRWSPIACGTQFEGSCRMSLVRFLDCEDNNNITKLIEGGQTLVNQDFDPYHLTHADNRGNVRMEFAFFRSFCHNANFPDLGMEYGVLGTFPASNFGHIYSDDEDDNNINYMLLRNFFGGNNQIIQSVPGLIDGNGNGINTNFYITWIN